MELSNSEYWKKNLKLLFKLLLIWFTVSFGAAILFADYFNQFSINGIPLAFWIAQQGSIYVFVLLIFYYTWRMNKIDEEYGVNED